MKVLLVTMPWHSLSYPSLALSILKRKAEIELPHVTVDQSYASLEFAEYVEALAPDPGWAVRYNSLGDTVFSGLGDWIFSSALKCKIAADLGEMRRAVLANGLDPAFVTRLHRIAPDFIERMANDVVQRNYDLVAFTSTFMQNAASLAAAKAIKARSPSTLIAMGGANCDGVQGTTLHRSFRFLDFVIRGEGERAFIGLLKAIEDDVEPTSVTGLCWRRADEDVVNADSGLLPITEMVEPNFWRYFETLAASPLRTYISPQLILEAARGCWWGEKHHCTFCGLNGSGMKFRSKDPHKVWHEIQAAVSTYKTLDVMMVDNIMDSRYVKTLLPKIAESDWDLRLHYEVKANLSPEDLRAFKRAKIEHIQPGIESLSTKVLRLMNKGTTGGQNVALLREAQNQNLTVSWNYLYGFPGEDEQDYLSVIAQMHNLVHLQPPSGAQRIAIERFSPLFNNPDLGVVKKLPAAFYKEIYALPEEVLQDLVFLFDAPQTGLRNDAEAKLQEAVARWRQEFNRSTLHAYETNGKLVIVDRRAGCVPRVHAFHTDFEIAGYLALEKSTTLSAVVRALETERITVDPNVAAQWWEDLRENGLVFVDGDRYTALATRDDPSNIRYDFGAAS
jgi:ribosomal peptide maturation radical SAM protein 1